MFPDDLTMAKVTLIYETGDSSDKSNYRPILVQYWYCFFKILERLMYNGLYKTSKEIDTLYEKSSVFTNDAIAQFVDQILYFFEIEQFTLGAFIDLQRYFPSY